MNYFEPKNNLISLSDNNDKNENFFNNSANISRIEKPPQIANQSQVNLN
jgi:hypothetical protein